MLHMDFFRDADRTGAPYRINSSYPLGTTIEQAEDHMGEERLQWVNAYEIVDEEGDILCVGIRKGL